MVNFLLQPLGVGILALFVMGMGFEVGTSGTISTSLGFSVPGIPGVLVYLVGIGFFFPPTDRARFVRLVFGVFPLALLVGFVAGAWGIQRPLEIVFAVAVCALATVAGATGGWQLAKRLESAPSDYGSM